jgi:hypothetical protein
VVVHNLHLCPENGIPQVGRHEVALFLTVVTVIAFRMEYTDNEGFIFPWTVSDFSLMDAIESGIVKIPRIPVDDDDAGIEPAYLNLWDHIAPPLPKRRQTRTEVNAQSAGWPMPATLQGALGTLGGGSTSLPAHLA